MYNGPRFLLDQTSFNHFLEIWDTVLKVGFERERANVGRVRESHGIDGVSGVFSYVKGPEQECGVDPQ